MDYKAVLQAADRNYQEAARQSKQIKRLNTNFSTPAIKEEKSSRPRSEVLQKLLDEKKSEERQKREAEERERRRKEKARQDREREEKRKNTFRIPKKKVPEDPPSDAESFSSISSGDEAKLSGGGAVNPFTPHGSAGSSSTQANSDRPHQSAGHPHGEKKHSLKSSSHEHSHKSSSHEHSHKSSSHEHSHHKEKPSHKSSSHEHAEKKEKQSHKSLPHDHAEKKDRHSHRSSEYSSGHSSSHRSSEHSSRGHSHHRSQSDKSKHHTEKLKHCGDRHGSGSSKSQGSSDQDNSPSSSHAKRSEQSSHKYRHIELNNKHIIIEDKAVIVGENDSSGYITSPDISSEEEGEAAPSVSKPPSTKKHSNHSSAKNHRNSVDTKRSSSTEAKEEAAGVPVTLSRHHFKPVKERLGGSLEERLKMLEKLKSIQQRNQDNDPGPSRKRSAWGEVKKRRAKREKLDGDFTGSCMEKINYDEEEKPSLKRPEPKPEETKEKVVKEKKRRTERTDGHKESKKRVNDRQADSKGSGKWNRFDEMHEKPKVRPKPAPRPPPLAFSDLMKLAEQKQTETVMVDLIPKKEKERRPLTQEELDRKQARQERVKTQEYKDWYKYGSSAEAKKNETGKPDSESGGFLQPSHDVYPPKSGAKSFSIPRKGDDPSSAPKDKRTPSTLTNRPAEVRNSANHSVPTPQPKPHPTRPGMIANKPQAMAQHINNQRRAEAARPIVKERQKVASSSSSQASSSAPQPKPSSSALADKTRQGSVWDNLFSRPEYKKMKEASESKKRKRVIDSDEEDNYEDDYDDLDDFIDDGEDEGAETTTVSSIIQQMFNYDRKKYSARDDDDANMEASFSEVMKEEARSARLGRQEDLEDIRREEEEMRQKKMMKKKGRL